MNQEHDRIKLFVMDYNGTEDFSKVMNEAGTWVATNKIAPKSIGIAYVDKDKKLVLSMGYRNDETPYLVQLSATSVGKIDFNSDLSQYEDIISDAMAASDSVVCHEMFITEDDVLHVILMSKAK
jgi:hypothetical protein